MRGIKFLTLFICVLSVLGLVCNASEPCSWYIVKRGNETPLFPQNSGEVRDLGGIYIDEKSITNGEKKLYLTFDAGYENGNIARILDILKEEGVVACFFVLSHLRD